jgi:creatinine amidohydrolase
MARRPTLSAAMNGQIDELALPDIRAFAPEVVVVPVGSTEAHAAHLPYGTDTWRVQAHVGGAVRLANERGARVLALPALPFGVNVNFTAYPLTVRLRVETLLAVMTDLVTGLAADGVRKIVVVNGHGGNAQALEAFLRSIHGQVRAFVVLVHPGAGVPAAAREALWFQGGGLHAGEMETAEILYLRPDTVHMERAVPPDLRPTRIDLDRMGAVYVRTWHHFTDTGGVGDPTRATAEQGRRWLAASTEALAGFLQELSDCPMGDQFPF